MKIGELNTIIRNQNSKIERLKAITLTKKDYNELIPSLRSYNVKPQYRNKVLIYKNVLIKKKDVKI